MKKLCIFLLAATVSIPAFCGFVEGEQAFNQQHYSQAFSEFLPLANEGDFRSQYYIGYLYVNGYGVSQDSNEGIRYLEMAADQDYDMAQALLGFLYAEGEVVPKDKKKALQLYQKAAAKNNTSAILNLGLMYYMGDGVARNYKTALDYFKRVPVAEKPIVSRYLGNIYLNNASFRDYEKALYYYELSARQKDLSAYFALGEIYKKGLGTTQDTTTAIQYYKYAATQNYPPAQYMLGIIYANGEGVSKDTSKAYAWLKIASDQNFEVATEALEKLTKSLSLNDLEVARRQVVIIQQNEMGKMDAPLSPVEPEAVGDPTVTGSSASAAASGVKAAGQNVSSGGSKRRGLRRRRRR